LPGAGSVRCGTTDGGRRGGCTIAASPIGAITQQGVAAAVLGLVDLATR
jgi:hypothetical protein